jgi:transcriptional regulator with PAS, ATPase and Fis domain
MDFPKDKVDLYRIFNHLDEGIILADVDDLIQWISSPGMEILGKNAIKMIGQHIDNFFIKGTEVTLIDETLTSVKLPGEEDKSIYITFTYVPLRDVSGGIWKGFLFRDISMIKDLEDALRMQKKEVSMVTKNSKMQEIIDLCLSVASSNVTALIQGESGTGKELIAHLIHQNSARKSLPFVRLNCAAFPETLLEGELFGHVKGAFTGAFTDKPGRFEIADGGTMFLDEIGELSPHLQVKLLRVLQSRSFERLGSNKTITVDVRIIAATNRNLKEAIKNGSFREDLYYRLSVVPVYLPPLRERKEDIPGLINHFLSEFKKKGYKAIRAVSSKAMNAFNGYNWPGNIRELENAIEHALVCTKDDYITINSLPFDIKEMWKQQQRELNPPKTATCDLKKPVSEKIIKSYKKVTVEECRRVLKECGGNKALAARVLGIDRTTLHRKIT